MKLETRILPPTAKYLAAEEPKQTATHFCGLKGEIISFQLAWKITENDGEYNSYKRCFIRIESAGAKLKMRRICNTQVEFPVFPGADNCYLNNAQPGIYPDVLMDVPEYSLKAELRRWSYLWVDMETDENTAAGKYDIQFSFIEQNTQDLLATANAQIEVLNAQLPKQTLIHTKWFHTDCLATYYGVEVFSEEYWRITENFAALAVKRGINMLLTPIHTPPLDTRVGHERPTVQLVDVYADESGNYSFGFEKLDRWVEMCKRCGVEYYEMAHLFTQWGAKHAPKIMAHTPTGYHRIFGWDTCATGAEYSAFLPQYLQALTCRLHTLGIAERCRFHISDEPTVENLTDYMNAKALVEPYLKGFYIMDALSNIEFYRNGAVERPVVGVDHIHTFIDENVPSLWGYYCCGHILNVSNLLIAMPGARTRALGAQMFKYDLEGFLQWGYNFYYSQLSDYPINPWTVNDAGGAFPAGDPFQVYPGKDGMPVDSLRSMHFLQAVQDLRAMRLLESLAGRQAVLDIIDEGLETPLRFDRCPYTDEYVLGLRDKINLAIARLL